MLAHNTPTKAVSSLSAPEPESELDDWGSQLLVGGWQAPDALAFVEATRTLPSLVEQCNRAIVAQCREVFAAASEAERKQKANRQNKSEEGPCSDDDDHAPLLPEGLADEVVEQMSARRLWTDTTFAYALRHVTNTVDLSLQPHLRRVGASLSDPSIARHLRKLRLNQVYVGTQLSFDDRLSLEEVDLRYSPVNILRFTNCPRLLDVVINQMAVMHEFTLIRCPAVKQFSYTGGLLAHTALFAASVECAGADAQTENGTLKWEATTSDKRRTIHIMLHGDQPRLDALCFSACNRKARYAKSGIYVTRKLITVGGPKKMTRSKHATVCMDSMETERIKPADVRAGSLGAPKTLSPESIVITGGEEQLEPPVPKLIDVIQASPLTCLMELHLELAHEIQDFVLDRPEAMPVLRKLVLSGRIRGAKISLPTLAFVTLQDCDKENNPCDGQVTVRSHPDHDQLGLFSLTLNNLHVRGLHIDCPKLRTLECRHTHLPPEQLERWSQALLGLERLHVFSASDTTSTDQFERMFRHVPDRRLTRPSSGHPVVNFLQ